MGVLLLKEYILLSFFRGGGVSVEGLYALSYFEEVFLATKKSKDFKELSLTYRIFLSRSEKIEILLMICIIKALRDQCSEFNSFLKF